MNPEDPALKNLNRLLCLYKVSGMVQMALVLPIGVAVTGSYGLGALLAGVVIILVNIALDSTAEYFRQKKKNEEV